MKDSLIGRQKELKQKMEISIQRAKKLNPRFIKSDIDYLKEIVDILGNNSISQVITVFKQSAKGKNRKIRRNLNKFR